MPELYVATLVAGKDSKLPATLVQSTLDDLQLAGAIDLRMSWIVDQYVADIFFGGIHFPPSVQKKLTDGMADCFVQSAQNRRKKLLVADMESTIIEQEMLDELADTIGIRDKVSNITTRAMNGELDFGAALRERVALLRGLPVCVLDDVSKRITLMAGAEKLLKGMKSVGASAWLVSGGFTCFAKPIADQLGFDKIFANELIIRDGMVTGEVAEPYLDKNSKKALLEKACAELGLTLADSVTVGDGANDIPMLSACNDGGGLGVAYHAKPNVRAVIPHQVNHSDLRALLYAQGLN